MIHLSALVFLIFAAKVVSDCLLTLNARLSVLSRLLGAMICVCQYRVWIVVEMCLLLSAAKKKLDHQAHRSTFGLDLAVLNIDPALIAQEVS